MIVISFKILPFPRKLIHTLAQFLKEKRRAAILLPRLAISTEYPSKATIDGMNRLTHAHALAFMVFCLLVAAALRLPNLSNVPPGLHYDEAANGILSADIGLRGELPIFISSYTGKEALFFYLAGIIMRLVGVSVFSLRLTAAFVGMLTVAATYWLGREMLADRRLAILAAALLAVSFWHVLFSRLGFRAITQPLLQALTVAALFRGLRRQDNRWLAVGGLFLGLTAYTYLAARLFPILLLIALIPLIFSPATFRLRWRQLALFAGVAIIILLPLLGYFFTHPNAFWVRIGQVAPKPTSTGLTLWESFLKSWGMFFLRGDTFWRFNLPGRPLFNWLWGALLVVGWLVTLLRWRRFPYDWQRAATTLLIFTPLVMILPTALATNELIPSNLRAIGLIPFIFYLPAIGVVILFHDIERRFGYPPLTFSVIFIALLLLLSGSLSTADTYFEDWAGETTLFYESDGDLAAVAQFLDKTDIVDKTVYVAAPHYRHPTVAFLSQEYENIKWLPESEALVFPPTGSALLVYPHNSPAPAWAASYLDLGQIVAAPTFEGPEDAFVAYNLPELPSLPVNNRVDINFGNEITLLGYEMTPTVAGSFLPVMIFWRVDSPATADYMPFLQLEDAWGHRWSQTETFAYPAEQWETGETIIQQVNVLLPVGMPPGTYRIRLGLFDPHTAERLPRLDQAGGFAGDAYLIENVQIMAGGVPASLPEPPFVEDQAFLPGLHLLGYERGGASAMTGAPWGLSLWWLATEPLPSLSTTLELVGNGGQVHTMLEGQPVHDNYPFEEWQPPQFIIDQRSLLIPATFPVGDYRLQLRLSELGGDDRLFIAPQVQTKIDATFGNEISLLGYDVSPLGDNVYKLVLIWQASQEPSADYTVFVHVLDQDGACCVWQQDTMPQQNQYPTSRWLPGEVVVDTFEVTLPSNLPPGEYPVEIGLYIAETGQRLTIEELPGEKGSESLLIQSFSIP
jgi:hypothetical protein